MPLSPSFPLLCLLSAVTGSSLSVQTPQDTLVVGQTEEQVVPCGCRPTVPLPPDTLATVEGTELTAKKLNGFRTFGKKMKHTGNLMARFIKNFDSYDTTYISPNYYNFTAMLQNTNYFRCTDWLDEVRTWHQSSISTKPAPALRSVRTLVGDGSSWAILSTSVIRAHSASHRNLTSVYTVPC